MAARRRGRRARPQPHLVRQPRRATWRSSLYGIPHVATVHSLEPMRPWKAEQLGGGYAVSSFCERTALEAADAIVAVSREQARDILACYPAIDPARVHVIHNGIDSERVPARPRHRRARAPRHRPGAAVGRLRRPHHAPEGRHATLLDAAAAVRPRARSSCSAPGAPDTPEIAAEIEAKVDARARGARRHRLDRRACCRAPRSIQILSHATRVRVPVDLRAARHRQPRGDGLRDGRRRDAHRAASPRSSRTA